MAAWRCLHVVHGEVLAAHADAQVLTVGATFAYRVVLSTCHHAHHELAHQMWVFAECLLRAAPTRVSHQTVAQREGGAGM